jgi:hypothetical protein
MNSKPASIADVASDPNWLPHRYDPGHDAFHFRRVERAAHRGATFLTDEYLGEEAAPIVVRRGDAMQANKVTAPVHYIFHSAYCCSTLLARAFDIPGISMALKEPVILNDLVGWRLRGGDPRVIGPVLNDSLALLARPFERGEATIIKPSNVCNGLAEAMLALRPEACALLLHAPLEVFIGSIAKKGMWGRLWVRDLLIKQLKEGMVDLGLESEDYLGLTDLQVAAVGWLAQQALFARLVARFGAARVSTIDSETLLAAPGAAVERLATLFRLGLKDAAVAAIVNGPAFTRHSKFDTEFGSEARSGEQKDAALVHGDEIEKVCAWARVLAENNGIPLMLPASLTA